MGLRTNSRGYRDHSRGVSVWQKNWFEVVAFIFFWRAVAASGLAGRGLLGAREPAMGRRGRVVSAVEVGFIEYYNHDRPHRSLALASPVPGNPSRDGPVTSRAVLGGLHHAYGRAA